MAVSAGTIEMLKELLGPLGAIGVRRMFGGAAIYCDGQVFALVGEDTVHFKVDDATRPDFEAEGCGPFTYALKDGRTQHLTTYHRIPEWLLDEPDELLGLPPVTTALSEIGH